MKAANLAAFSFATHFIYPYLRRSCVGVTNFGPPELVVEVTSTSQNPNGHDPDHAC
jgi:hypothetical protein